MSHVPEMFRGIMVRNDAIEAGIQEFLFQDLSESIFSAEDKNFLCREIAGTQCLLEMGKCSEYYISLRYNVKREKVRRWFSNYCKEKVNHDRPGNPCCIDDAAGLLLTAKLKEARDKHQPLTPSEKNAEILDLAKQNGDKRKVDTYLETEHLDPRTIQNCLGRYMVIQLYTVYIFLFHY